jgi:metal-responsive CopG/Arc/MetJ family transcriptional regulator
MRPIQVVLDDDLLARVDRAARKRKASRSATMRRLLEAGLERESIAALVEAERAAYAKQPATREERDSVRALTRAQARVLDKLAREQPW